MSTYTARSHGRHIRHRRFFAAWIWPAALALVSIALMTMGMFVLKSSGLDVMAAFAPLSAIILGGVVYGVMISAIPDRRKS